MLILTKCLPSTEKITVNFTVYLTAEQRLKTRQRLEMSDSQSLYIRLPRGTVLNDGDLLQSETEDTIVRIAAKPESVITVTAKKQLDLLKAAYHLGNRHVSLEITSSYLRLAPDPVLYSMLVKLGLDVKEEVSLFFPEIGAYGHH
ncbi:MAG: urease accessory protein UreE [Moorea sp. SIO2B7]|nr:urease accessory protein UreE [Moorena sp. SIO2B7]